MWILYQVALASVLLIAAPYFLLTRGRHYLPTLPGRLGLRYPESGPGGVWLHAVSVGEVGVAAILARALPPEVPLLVTTVTPTGQARARAVLGNRATVAYLPFDLGTIVGRFLRHFQPRAVVLCEGDLWPLVLRAVKQRGLPVVVINGRISDRGFRRLRRLGRLRRALLSPVDHFAVQSRDDARRLQSLGIDERHVSVTGNLKFEAAPTSIDESLKQAVQHLASGRPILVAGSTMEGEEETVLEAYATLGGEARALLVLAPRHPERWPQVSALLRSRGLVWIPRSTLSTITSHPVGVILLDSLGELAGLYELATAAFIGGTLVPTGGHNPLEAATWAIPIAVGPFMDNFRDIAERFDEASAWKRVLDSGELASSWARWIEDPSAAQALGRRGKELLDANRGALQRTLTLLETMLPLDGPPRKAEPSSPGTP